MEGLIPMLFNALKKKKSKKYYKSLSSSPAFVDEDAESKRSDLFFMTPPPETHKVRSEMVEYGHRGCLFMTPQRESYGGRGHKKHRIFSNKKREKIQGPRAELYDLD